MLALWLVAPALILDTCTAIAGPSRWVPFGIGGGGYTCGVTFDPSNECRILTGSDVTGLCQSADGGRSWQTFIRGLSSYYVHNLIVHPTDSDLLFACTQRGLSRSTDHGRTWDTVLELILHDSTHSTDYSASFSHVTVDAIDPGVIWSAVGRFRLSNVDAGGDSAAEYPHLWRSESYGAPGSWEGIPHGGGVGGPLPTTAVHTILTLPYDWDAEHPGCEMFMISTNDSVWMGVYDAMQSKWNWIPRNGILEHRLPHGDARDMQAKWNDNGEVERLYVVLNSLWDNVDPNSIYRNDLGYGGGVWYSEDLGVNWYPTSYASGEDSFHLELGSSEGDKPKNMRRLAINQEDGRVFVALTERSMANEGVWMADFSRPDWFWRRITESRTYNPWDKTCNMEHGYFPTLGGVDGLAVQRETGDVVFNSSINMFRCPGGDCMPGDTLAPIWENLAMTPVGSSPKTFRTKGINVTQVYDVMVAPADTSIWFFCAGDIGLARSDDRGVSWRLVMDTASPPYTEYRAKNCHGIYLVPGTSEPEWLGIFGYWAVPERFGLWRTVGLPDTSSSWEQVPGLPWDAKVTDVEFLAEDTMLVGTDSSVYLGTRLPGESWALTLDMEGVPPESSCLVNDLAVVPGGGTERRMIVAMGQFNPDTGAVKRGHIYYRDGVDEPWQPATYASGPSRGMGDVRALCWSKIDRSAVYAGNASRQFGDIDAAGVLKSTDMGESWFMTSQTMGDYAASTYDLVGVATLLETGSESDVEWVYACLMPDDEPPDRASTFGGVFASTDGGGSWFDRSEGLEAGIGAFISDDPTNPSRLFFGTFGNGVYRLREDFDHDTHCRTEPPVSADCSRNEYRSIP